MNGLDPAGGATALSTRELAELSRLRALDRHVRAHEQAHLAAAGPFARSGPTYQYASGPDHALYAVAGEVAIDTSPIAGNPEGTIQKMVTVIAAAHAPADPSSQDNLVAAQAAQELSKAQAELAKRAYGADLDAGRSTHSSLNLRG